MFFLWPQFLWLMLALPLLLAAYVWLLRRKRQSALRYSSLGVVRAAATGRQWRQHLPPALMLLACTGLLLASARPVTRITLPWSRSTVMLAMDVSLSMRVTDVLPTRMAAAQEAAKSFLLELPKGIEVGLVTFAASSQVVQPATRDRDAVAAAIDAFQMQMGTAVGNAIVVCLAELFPEHRLDVGEMTFGGGYGGNLGRASEGRARGRSLDESAKPPPLQITPVPPGSYESAAIILLSDGRRTTGIDTLAAAKMAADRGVRIYAIGLGTVDGEASAADGMPIYLKLDEPTLREVARMTGGEYHYAGTAKELRSVYEKLGSRMQVQTRETEVSSLMALAAAVVALVAAVLSLRWFGRVA